MRALLACFCLVCGVALAAGDVDKGRKLVAEKHCDDCHASKTLGDAKAVYLRKDRKVTTFAKLKAQVALCNSELNLQMFPDEEDDVVAFLDREYYHFSARAAPSPSTGTSRTH